MSETHLSMVENAFDFIDNAISRLAASDLKPVEIKYIILHLSSGIALLLKQPLAEKDWHMIVKNSESISKEKFDDGDFISINYDETLKRLKNNLGIKLDDTEFSYLKQLRDERNKMEHHIVKYSKEQITPLILFCCGVVMNLIDQFNIRKDNKNLDNKLDSIVQNMVKLKKFTKERLTEIEPKIDKLKKDNAKIIYCPTCFQLALGLTKSARKCEFCKTSFTLEELRRKWFISFTYKNRLKSPQFKKWLNSPKNKEQRQLFTKERLKKFEQILTKDSGLCDLFYHQCLECKSRNLLFEDVHNYWVCFNCAKSWTVIEIALCVWCDEVKYIEDINTENLICLQCENDSSDYD